MTHADPIVDVFAQMGSVTGGKLCDHTTLQTAHLLSGLGSHLAFVYCNPLAKMLECGVDSFDTCFLCIYIYICVCVCIYLT